MSQDYEEAVCTDENFDCENYMKVKLHKYCLDIVDYSDYVVSFVQFLSMRQCSNWTGLHRNMVITGKISSIPIDTDSLI